MPKPHIECVWYYMATLPTELSDHLLPQQVSRAIDKAADEGRLRNARNLPTAQRAHTRQNPIVHTGFEPVSPDPKSGMIDHYTKGLINNNIVIYIHNLFVRDL